MRDPINYILSDEIRFELLRELAENKTVSYEKLIERFDRQVLDLLEAHKFILRIFVKRGNRIWSFYKLSEEGFDVFFTLRKYKGNEDNERREM